MKKAYFIFNPHSGKQKSRDSMKQHIIPVIDKITKSGYEVTVRPTQCQQDAYFSVKDICKRNEFDVIACSGGDGTLNEVIRGIMESENRPPVLYMPTGTTNDFAQSLGISKNPDEACKSIEKGSFFSCDICSFNDRFFTYVAAFGAFIESVYETPQQMKNAIGHTAYILDAMKRIKSLEKSYHLKVKYNDDNIVEDDFVFGMITNSTSIGGVISTSSDVLMNDGLFEVTLIKKPSTLIEFQNIMTALFSKKHDIDKSESEYIITFKSDYAEITCDEEFEWTLDGEYGGKESRVIIKNNPEAVDFFINSEIKL